MPCRHPSGGRSSARLSPRAVISLPHLLLAYDSTGTRLSTLGRRLLRLFIELTSPARGDHRNP